LSRALQYLTPRQLSDQTETEVASRFSMSALLPRSRLQGLARAFAGVVFHAIARVEWVFRQHFEDTAEAAELDRRASIRGLYRLPAARATGSVTFTGTGTVPSGSRVRRADGIEFETTAAVTLSMGTGTAPVEGVLAGASANTAAAMPLTLTSPVTGVSSSAVVAAGGITGGADRESDELMRDRLLERLREPSQGGAPADYVRWAREVPGVTRAWAQRAYPQPGSVGLTFVVDDDPGGMIPSPAKVAEVTAYIEDPTRLPATAVLECYAPGTQEIDIDLELTPDTLTVRDSVEASLAAFFKRNAAPGQTVLLSQIREAISTAAGETDHVLTAPVADVTVPAGTIAILGTVTFA
jgi:uncharacterized phage protein gp47/JayE